MNSYKIIIELYVRADNEAEAYEEACRQLGANQLSRELCDIKKEEED